MEKKKEKKVPKRRSDKSHYLPDDGTEEELDAAEDEAEEGVEEEPEETLPLPAAAWPLASRDEEEAPADCMIFSSWALVCWCIFLCDKRSVLAPA